MFFILDKHVQWSIQPFVCGWFHFLSCTHPSRQLTDYCYASMVACSCSSCCPEHQLQFWSAAVHSISYSFCQLLSTVSATVLVSCCPQHQLQFWSAAVHSNSDSFCQLLSTASATVLVKFQKQDPFQFYCSSMKQQQKLSIILVVASVSRASCHSN